MPAETATHTTIRKRTVPLGNPAWMAQVVNDRGHSVTMMLPTHEAAMAAVPGLIAELEAPARERPANDDNRWRIA